MNEDNYINVANLIKRHLAETIGVDVDDIKDEDTFLEDLHMSPAEFSDFLASLEKFKIDPSAPDIANANCVVELIEAVSSQIVE